MKRYFPDTSQIDPLFPLEHLPSVQSEVMFKASSCPTLLPLHFFGYKLQSLVIALWFLPRTSGNEEVVVSTAGDAKRLLE